MSSAPPPVPQYEFTGQQSDLIRGLSYRMSGVGFVFLLLGMLQIAYGISVLVIGQNPEKLMTQIAERLKVPVEQIPKEQFNQAALTTMALAICLVGFVHFLIGIWTRQSATGFTAVANTRGQDITRLMEALTSLKKMYGLVYNIMLIGALIVVASVGYHLYLQFKAG
jgi:uncharacterized membrane protein YiaA